MSFIRALAAALEAPTLFGCIFSPLLVRPAHDSYDQQSLSVAYPV
jgi:enterochelin esterase-like enzyme